MTVIIMLSILIVLNVIQLTMRLFKIDDIKRLERTVLKKKLILSEKVLDSQLENGINLSELQTNKETKGKIQTIGFNK